MIRVAVIGATGRMGSLTCRAVDDDADLTLVAAVARHGVGARLAEVLGDPAPDVVVSDDLQTIVDAGAEVAVDFTTPQAVMGNVRWAVSNGVHVVVGTSGLGPEDLEEIRASLDGQGDRRANVVVVPNFAIGAVLMQRFAVEASRFFPAAEIVELHHDGKADAPSGTALATARRMGRARSEPWRGPDRETVPGSRGGDVEGLRIHSVRLPGLVAHQEVVFGGLGEILTIRHDSLQRSSFMPGVVLAVKAVPDRPGLTVGLEPLLGFPPDD